MGGSVTDVWGPQTPSRFGIEKGRRERKEEKMKWESEVLIEVPSAELEEMQRVIDGGQLDDRGEMEVIKCYTADFGDGIEADIKICNGDTPFIDPVLFDNGCEIALLDVRYTLEGIYLFETGEDAYIVKIKRTK